MVVPQARWMVTISWKILLKNMDSMDDDPWGTPISGKLQMLEKTSKKISASGFSRIASHKLVVFTRSIDWMGTLIQHSLLVWDYLRSPDKNLFFLAGYLADWLGLYPTILRRS